MPLHRGAEGFMSQEQFKRFYWPGLKKTIEATIKLGLYPWPHFEGKFDSRLEYLLEDMVRAKEILGGHLCIVGAVPSPLLQVGSPSEVEEYCKNLIKACGKGGGFILSNGGNTDYAKPENLKAMIDSVKKFG
jgi:uroporphyrinogen-III decarboxylase